MDDGVCEPKFILHIKKLILRMNDDMKLRYHAYNMSSNIAIFYPKKILEELIVSVCEYLRLDDVKALRQLDNVWHDYVNILIRKNIMYGVNNYKLKILIIMKICNRCGTEYAHTYNKYLKHRQCRQCMLEQIRMRRYRYAAKLIKKKTK